MHGKAGWGISLVAFVLTFGSGAVAHADTGQTSAQSSNLSLTACLHMVIRSNPSVREGWLQWLIKSRQARATAGAFEPTLDGGYNRSALTQQNTALQQYQQFGAETYDQKSNVYSLGINGRLPTGATYDVSTSVTRLEDTYAELGQYRSAVTVTAQQPLLKGFTHGAPLVPIRAAREDRIIAFQQYRKQLMNIITQAESAYWNLAFAQRAEAMAADSVRVARYLLQVATSGAAVGRMSNLDVEQAQAELASRRAVEADAKLSVSDAEYQLRLLMGGEQTNARTVLVASDPLVASDQPGKYPHVDEQELLAWAMRAQPDYMVAVGQSAREHILVGYQADQALPELNVTGSYGYTGLGNTVEDSLDSLNSRGYPTWSVGIEMKIPILLGIEQRNMLKAEKLKWELAVSQERTARDQMEASIRSVLRNLTTLEERVKNAQTVAEVKRRLLDVEMARLEKGTVSLVDVYYAQDALDAARERALQAVVRYRKGIMQLEVTSGTVLKNQGLEALQDGQVQLAESLRSR